MELLANGGLLGQVLGNGAKIAAATILIIGANGARAAVHFAMNGLMESLYTTWSGGGQGLKGAKARAQWAKVRATSRLYFLFPCLWIWIGWSGTGWTLLCRIIRYWSFRNSAYRQPTVLGRGAPGRGAECFASETVCCCCSL